ncbi:MAG TPA: ABC-F family ATP-binding cassette domain-containing protein [Tepidisphaeraceae bacterium]|nr:ABC-F family ATP-binding cassette domain-containing protein [Tepidisphaeraceae bacterium]
MPLLTLQNLEKSFGDRIILNKADLLLDRGERVGLIGDNGTGKTTLFKVITGEMEPEAGVVAINRGLKIGHLTQQASFDPANTVIDEAELAFAHLHELAHRMRELEHAMAEHTDDDLDRTLKKYEELQHEFEADGGYAWQHKLEGTLLGVGLTREVWETNVEKLSGGQRSRLNLAKILIAEPDVLLLDEPTNHLDLAAIEWLEDYLLQFSGAVLLISHDRYLLDRLATRIVWLTQAKLRSYPGNYTAFTEQRELQELSQQRAYEQQQAHIDKTKEFVRRFGAGQRAREAKGREKVLNRLLKSDAMVDAVAGQKKIHFSMETDQRAGDQVLQVRELSKSFGDLEIWSNLAFRVTRGERIGIVGPNGSGKTTLLRVLLGEEDASAGHVKWGANLSIGYYDQRLDDFDPDNSILEELADGRPPIPEQKLRDLLGIMLFSGDTVDKPMHLLSGGEKARVAFCELLLDEPNVLLLDEPTNHLDIASADALERALSAFAGTIICVSHDRYFLDRATARTLILTPPTMVDFDGKISAYLQKQREAAKVAKAAGKSRPESKAAMKPAAKKEAASPPKHPAPAARAPKDNPYKRPFGKLSVAEIEKKIQETERAIGDSQEKFAQPELLRDASRSRKLQQEFDALRETLAELEAEYFTRET